MGRRRRAVVVVVSRSFEIRHISNIREGERKGRENVKGRLRPQRAVMYHQGCSSSSRASGGGVMGACPREPTAALILPSGPLAEVDRRGNFVSGARKPGIEPAASFHHWSSPRRARAGPRRCRGPSGQMCLKSISTAADATSRAALLGGL